MIWSKLHEIIAQYHTFILSSHVNPDGDSICSELALYWYLQSLGKNVVIFNADPVPVKFRFLTNSDLITNRKPSERFDVLFIVDASNPSRLGWKGYETIAGLIVNIDHHRDNNHTDSINFVDYEASATSQILYRFFLNSAIVFPAHVAQTLYTGIMTDTGGFQFSNTTSEVLRMCADLADMGAQCSEIYRKVYSSYSVSGLLLRAKVWSTLTFYNNNRICVMEMPIHAIEEYGANYGDIEGMSDLALIAADVEVGMFIKYTETTTHFSLRSKGNVDVGKIAQTIPGGGGHTCAAGCTVDQPVTMARDVILKRIQKELV